MSNIYFKTKIKSDVSSISFVTAILVSFFSFQNVNSQVSFLNKGVIYNNNNQFVINGNVTHQQEGSIINSGNLYIRGNWTNNNPTSQVFSTGTNGWVHLDSVIVADTQRITGATITHFNNLELIGYGVKMLDSINVDIEDTLALNNKEFLAGDNTVFILSTGTGVVTRSSGFVSNTNDGGLSRNVVSAEEYIFPVGSSVGTLRYRPIKVVPSTDNTFKVRMANVNADDDNYTRSSKEPTLNNLNANFYHKISSTNSSDAADVTIYYDPTTDGNYQLIAQWDNMWKNVGIVSEGYDPNESLFSITKSGHTNFSNTPFILAEEVPAVFVANVFSPNSDGMNDILHLLGNSIDELTFSIYDRWGEKVFETTDATVGWDGTFKGKAMNIGVFVYFAKGKFKNGEEFDKSGNVTLLR